MYRKFPEDLGLDELTNIDGPEYAKGRAQAKIDEFLSFLVDIYLETGVADHQFTVLFNPESTSVGSGQMVAIRIHMDDNFS